MNRPPLCLGEIVLYSMSMITIQATLSSFNKQQWLVGGAKTHCQMIQAVTFLPLVGGHQQPFERVTFHHPQKVTFTELSGCFFQIVFRAMTSKSKKWFVGICFSFNTSEHQNYFCPRMLVVSNLEWDGKCTSGEVTKENCIVNPTSWLRLLHFADWCWFHVISLELF